MAVDRLTQGAVVAFVASSNLDRSRAFYQDTLGLTLREGNDFACVFDVGATMLRVTAVGEVVVAGYTVLGWRVGDIAATIDSLSAAGVVFVRYDGMPQDERAIWTAPDTSLVAWFRDPDGNTLSLTQFAEPA